MAGTLRITSGILSRRRFMVPKEADDGKVRPASDKVRGAIFSSLGPLFQDANVLDLFGGSGAYSFESISRGAKEVCLVEMHPKVAECIKQNAKDLGIQSQVQVNNYDAIQFIKKAPIKQFNIVFVDPPYTVHLQPNFWVDLAPWLAPDAVIVFRCSPKDDFKIPEKLPCFREKKYGNTVVYFLKNTYEK